MLSVVGAPIAQTGKEATTVLDGPAWPTISSCTSSTTSQGSLILRGVAPDEWRASENLYQFFPKEAEILILAGMLGCYNVLPSSLHAGDGRVGFRPTMPVQAQRFCFGGSKWRLQLS